MGIQFKVLKERLGLKKLAVLILLMIVSMASPSFGDDLPPSPDSEGKGSKRDLRRSRYRQGHHVTKHEEHDHHMGVFYGMTFTKVGHVDSAHKDHVVFTMGTDYEYRLPMWDNRLGIGLLLDVVVQEHVELLFSGTFILRPVGEFEILLGAGMEIAKHHDEDHKGKAHGGGGGTPHSDIKGKSVISPLATQPEEKLTWQPVMLWRIGAAYLFHAGPFSIAPTVNFDLFSDKIAIVAGLTFGLPF